MSDRVEELEVAARDRGVRDRFYDKVTKGVGSECWLWTGAISGKGHGRFWVAANLVVVAHRFAWLLSFEAHTLPEVVSHRCDNPICQNPTHLRASTWSKNRIEYLQRRGTPGSPLRDTRGARGRSTALRDAAKQRLDIAAAKDAGLSELDRYQGTLW